jgi:sugar lactone lactonase YvrE
VGRTRSAVGLDFHQGAGLVFWSDSLEGRIYRVKLADEQRIAGGGNTTAAASGRRVVVDHGADDGLAVDWVNDNLYFVKSVEEGRRRIIAVTDFDGRVVVDLIDSADDADKPRALAVHPGRGSLFWSDWGRRPRIEKAGLDGTGRETLVRDGIVWPNGLALDLAAERLYWVDAKLHRLSSVSVDGGAVRVVLESAARLHHPYGLAVFEDWAYWTEWGRNTSAIYRANKFTGGQLSQFNQSSLVRAGGITRVKNFLGHFYHRVKILKVEPTYGGESGFRIFRKSQHYFLDLILPSSLTNEIGLKKTKKWSTFREMWTFNLKSYM